MFLKAGEIEFPVCADQFKFPQMAAVVIAHGTIGAPMPVAGQDVVAPFGIVMNDVMEDAGTAGGCASADIAFRAGFAKALVDNGVQIFRISLNRRIRYDFFRRQGLEGFFYNVKHDQIAVFIQNRTDRAVNDFVCP